MIENIISGLILLVSTQLFIFLYRSLRKRRFCTIFGKNSNPDNPFYIFFAPLKMKKDQFKEEDSNNWLFHRDGFNFRASSVVGISELRATKYLLRCFKNVGAPEPSLNADTELQDNDLSYVAFGGLNNNKSKNAMKGKSNRLIRFNDNGDGLCTNGDQSLQIPIPENKDVGMILSVCPGELNNRVWLVCAGLGEWGTSGAAFYLANNWKVLLNRKKGIRNKLGWGEPKPFAALINVKQGSDEEATLDCFFETKEDVADYVRSSKNNISCPTTAKEDLGVNPDADTTSYVKVSVRDSNEND